MRKYKVGVNCLKDDADYCQYVDKQYETIIECETIEEVENIAKQKILNEYGEAISPLAIIKIAWIEEIKNGR